MILAVFSTTEVCVLHCVVSIIRKVSIYCCLKQCGHFFSTLTIPYFLNREAQMTLVSDVGTAHRLKVKHAKAINAAPLCASR